MPPKRLSSACDRGDLAEMPLRKTQRTHEENQERAYIAASRRADRDIEHRMMSAHKASECRRKRTGRGLKITREAVLGDEQYESEDDDPTTRRYSMPALVSNSTGALASPFLPQASRADRYAEVDALFAKHFPHVQLSSRWGPSAQTHTHLHGFPQPLHHSMAYVPRRVPCTTAATHHPSPPFTPPVSGALPVQRREGSTKSRSMSPLHLEKASRPNDPNSPAPASTAGAASAQLAAIGVSDYSGLPDSSRFGLGNDDLLMANHSGRSPDAQHNEASPGGAYLYTTPPTSADDNHPDLTAWYNANMATTSRIGGGDGGGGTGGGGGGWHSRSLSLPSHLEQFTFSFPGDANPSPMTTATPETDAAMLSLVDPSILGCSVASSVASVAAPVEGIGEPWADWVNLDGEVPPPPPSSSSLGQPQSGQPPLGVAV